VVLHRGSFTSPTEPEPSGKRSYAFNNSTHWLEELAREKSELSDFVDGLHFGRLTSGGDLGDSDAVSVTLPEVSRCGGGGDNSIEWGSDVERTAGEVLDREMDGRRGKVGVVGVFSRSGGEGP
jgi:hypothetical protein